MKKETFDKNSYIKTFGKGSRSTVDRSDINLEGIQYTLNMEEFTCVIHPNSYDKLKSLVGNWFWENWVFDGGDTIEFHQDEIYHKNDGGES
jgi:hypothetical protein